MAPKDHADDRDGGTEPKFYLPAGITPSSETSWFESIRATLFDHRI
jgi:hypothetical protein